MTKEKFLSTTLTTFQIKTVMRREKSINLGILFDYKYRILRAKMTENVYKTMWNNNIAITKSFNNAVRYKKLDKCTLSHTRRKRS